MIGMRPSSFEEDLSLIDWIKLGTVIDMAITMQICITCTTQTSFINHKGSESCNDWDMGWLKRIYDG
jgi:hypothetical protein